MGKKLSGLKSKKIINYCLKGYSQTEIAAKLNVDQSTVSKYINKFKIIQEQKGTDAALLEFESEVPLEENQTIISEFKKSNLDPSDIQIALQLENVLQDCGIAHKDYPDLIQTVKKTKDKKDYISSAQILNQIENTTGLSYQDIINKANQAQKQLVVLQKELSSIKTEIDLTKAKLAEIEQKKLLAAQDFKKHMQQIGVDEQRLQSIEALALAMKKAKIHDYEIKEYIKRQELLNQAGISINVLTDILNKSKVAIEGDNGKMLIDMLTEYGSLTGVIDKQKAGKELLEKEISGLEAQAKLKGKLDAEVNKLKMDKVTLEANAINLKKQIEGYDSQLQKQKTQLDQLAESYYSIQLSCQELLNTKKQLDEEISEKQAVINSIDVEIKNKDQKLSNLKELEAKHEQLLKDNTELESRISQQKMRWQAFEGFVGMVQSSSMEEFKKNTNLLHGSITQLEPGKYSQEFLKNFILKNLAGYGLQVLKCTTCQARFIVDKVSPAGGYKCPFEFGPSHLVVIEKDADVILKEAMLMSKPINSNVANNAQFKIIRVQKQNNRTSEHKDKL
jgi:hypothetical protein